MLFVWAEALDLVDGGGEDVGWSEGRVLLEGGDEAVFAGASRFQRGRMSPGQSLPR